MPNARSLYAAPGEDARALVDAALGWAADGVDRNELADRLAQRANGDRPLLEEAFRITTARLHRAPGADHAATQALRAFEAALARTPREAPAWRPGR